MRLLKKRIVLVMMMFIFVAAISLASNAQRKKHIAILDFEFNMADQGAVHSVYGDVKNLCRQVSDRLEVNMVNLRSYNLVERREVAKLIKEQDYGQAGRIDPDTAARIGKILGVDALVVGSLTQLEFTGLPDDQLGGVKYWAPYQLKAKLVLNFRVVDATTGRVAVAQEAIGLSYAGVEQNTKENFKDRFSEGAKRAFRIFGGGNKGPSVEDYKRVINLSVDDAVAKIAQQLDEAESNAQKPIPGLEGPKATIEGVVFSVKATTIFVTGVEPSQVKVGDRLFIRRFLVGKDPRSGKEIRYNDKVGELEITEMQGDVIVGAFSGADSVKIGDTVTNK